MPQRREAAIVGIYEYPLRVNPQVSAMQIKAECAARALQDAGLTWQDVDAVYDTGGDQGIGGLGAAEYFGFNPRVIDTTYVGGTSTEFQTNHARAMLAAGKCNVALVTYGSTSHSDRRAIGTAGETGVGVPTVTKNMEDPWGLTTIAGYAMVKSRHMYQYGTTNAQFAHISVATRRHAMRNPEAVKAMTDLEFVGVRGITVDDVLSSRVIAHPLRLLECCMVSDGGGALVIASPQVVRHTRKPPVWIIGSGEATKYRTNNADITVSAGAQSGPIAFGDAGVSPAEIDVLMAYDSFTITVMCLIEDLGFCPKGSVWATVEAQPVVEHLLVQVPRRGTQPGREATLALRFCPLTLCPPRYRKSEGLPSVALWAVQVREIDPPRDVKPIEWLLLTTVEVRTAADAIERVTWYACRWGIEVWHRILKSGCRIEERQLATSERLQRCLTLYSVIAWRVFYAIMLARAVPEMPCNVLLEIEEWQALYCAIHHCPTPPEEPPTLGEAVRWMAQLGGLVGRRRRDQPGAETLWRGFRHLSDLTRMYCIMRPVPP